MTMLLTTMFLTAMRYARLRSPVRLSLGRGCRGRCRRQLLRRGRTIGTSSAPGDRRRALFCGLGIQVLGSFQRFGHTTADILRSDMFVEFGLMHSLRWLLPCPTKDQLSSGFVDAVGKIF